MNKQEVEVYLQGHGLNTNGCWIRKQLRVRNTQGELTGPVQRRETGGQEDIQDTLFKDQSVDKTVKEPEPLFEPKTFIDFNQFF